MYINAFEATEQSLRMQALGITVTLSNFIQNLTLKRLQIEGNIIMSQMLIDERWEGIAFLSLYDENGRVVLHSNPFLVGRTFDDIKNLKDKKTPFYHRIKLGTGEEVFVSDTKMQIGKNYYILRVALHTYPAEALMRTAKTNLIFIIFSSLIIISSGIIGVLIMNRIEKMQLKMKELETLSMLSRVMAHEIRNPLGSIKGFTQYLIKRTTDQKTKEYLEIILKESLRLERLSDELSHYANPHSIRPSEFNLRELLNEIVFYFRSQYNVNITINVEEIIISTDRDKLNQIITNILQNAVDAVEESETKNITIKAERINDKIKIEISDTGIGMDEETLRRAKEAFFTTKSKGTGLGLAIVNKLCESLKIEFKIESKKDRGTTVWLTIPQSL